MTNTAVGSHYSPEKVEGIIVVTGPLIRHRNKTSTAGEEVESRACLQSLQLSCCTPPFLHNIHAVKIETSVHSCPRCCCLLAAEHPSNMLVYLRGGSAHIIIHAVTMRSKFADQTFHLTHSRYTDTGPISPRIDTTSPGAWQGSHWSTNF